jgi:predicted TPR repeat methyltransferase
MNRRDRRALAKKKDPIGLLQIAERHAPQGRLDQAERSHREAIALGRPRSSDVIASAATLIHFGALDGVFAAAASCLRPRGLFVFTVFPNDDDPAAAAVGTLNGAAQNGCFRHGTDYIARTAAACGLQVELVRREVHEYARKSAIPGLVVALRLAP